MTDLSTLAALAPSPKAAPPPAASAPAGVGEPAPKNARSTLSENFDTFLTLLTAQLDNQDPLDPVDSGEFTQQLVQYSQVEQQIATNEKLDGLTDKITTQAHNASSGAMLSLLGRAAEFDSDSVKLRGGQANWTYYLNAGTARTTLSVLDGAGKVVYAAPGAIGAGKHNFAWDGLDQDGGALPEGLYRLVVTAEDATGQASKGVVTVEERISGVEMSGDGTNVMTPSAARTFDSIIRINEAAPT